MDRIRNYGSGWEGQGVSGALSDGASKSDAVSNASGSEPIKAPYFREHGLVANVRGVDPVYLDAAIALGGIIKEDRRNR